MRLSARGLPAIFILSSIGLAQDSASIGYVAGLKGKWQYAENGRDLAPLSLLNSGSGLRMVAASGTELPSIRLRFFPSLCEAAVACSDAATCAKPMAVKEIYDSHAESCKQEPSWASSISSAFHRFFQAGQANALALALTVSRSVEPGDVPDDAAALQDAVLLLDEGRFDPASLFRPGASGAFWLQFCPPGPALSNDCADAGDMERVAVKLAGGRPEPAAFPGAEGLYRVRLWKMTPRGAQPTEQMASALIGAASRYAQTQREFLEISAGARDMARNDPMIRLMLGAWLAQRQMDTKP